MDVLSFVVISITVAFNFIIIIHKYRKLRYADATLDMLLFALICFLFSGTYSALVVGTMSSMLISLYLLFNPFKLSNMFSSDEDEDDVY